MVKLSREDVEKVAGLAKLKLTSEEIEKFRGQLSEVIDYMEILSEVEAEKVEPTAQTTGLTNVVRKDEVDPSSGLSQEEALSGTEKTLNGYFVVEAVFEKNEK